MRALAIVLLCLAAVPSYAQESAEAVARTVINVRVARGGGYCPATQAQSAPPMGYPMLMYTSKEGRAVVGVCARPDGRARSFTMLSRSGSTELDDATAFAACGRIYPQTFDAAGAPVASCAHVFDFTWRLRDFPDIVVCTGDCDRFWPEVTPLAVEAFETLRAELEALKPTDLFEFVRTPDPERERSRKPEK